ncbi:MAG: hypothetical protein K2N29_07800, partial [Ruminiclostridium sp.]|nr:hypothetical protein [Ruminiclostridium sp.]
MGIRKCIKKAATVFLIIAVCVGTGGCDTRVGQSGELVSVPETDRMTGGVLRAYLPIKREDGR